MTALLAMIPTKDKIYGVILLALILGGFWYHHKLIAEGIADQKAADDKASATLVSDTAKQTAELKAKATMAEQAYDKEVNSLNSLPTPVVRLCTNNASNSILPKGSAINSGNDSAGTAASVIQRVPSGDPSSAGPNIGGMLAALAASADQVSSTLREYQSR